MKLQKITPCLWFDGQAEEAMQHYISIFENGRVLSVKRCGDEGPGPKGSVLIASFEIAGVQFQALNGGPQYKFTEAISMSVDCESQEEVDRLWAKLSEGGKEIQCGWLRDKYGLSWQIVPRRLIELINDADPARAARAFQAMLQMVKIDIATIETAADGR